MACNRCGRRCQGRLCRECERDAKWAAHMDATVAEPGADEEHDQEDDG